jgi:hypothetical protein
MRHCFWAIKVSLRNFFSPCLQTLFGFPCTWTRPYPGVCDSDLRIPQRVSSSLELWRTWMEQSPRLTHLEWVGDRSAAVDIKPWMKLLERRTWTTLVIEWPGVEMTFDVVASALRLKQKSETLTMLSLIWKRPLTLAPALLRVFPNLVTLYLSSNWNDAHLVQLVTKTLVHLKVPLIFSTTLLTTLTRICI